MARRGNGDSPAVTGEAKVMAQQLVLYQGRNVAEVTPDDKGVTVWRKRDSSTKYERRFFPNDRVIAYVAGEGGTAASTAMALVLDLVVLHQVQGTMERDDYATVITDDDGHEHVFPQATTDKALLTIRETAERPDGAPDAEETDAPKEYADDGGGVPPPVDFGEEGEPPLDEEELPPEGEAPFGDAVIDSAFDDPTGGSGVPPAEEFDDFPPPPPRRRQPAPPPPRQAPRPQPATPPRQPQRPAARAASQPQRPATPRGGSRGPAPAPRGGRRTSTDREWDVE